MSPYLCAAMVLTGNENRLSLQERERGKKAIQIATPGGRQIIKGYIGGIRFYGVIAAMQFGTYQWN